MSLKSYFNTLVAHAPLTIVLGHVHRHARYKSSALAQFTSHQLGATDEMHEVLIVHRNPLSNIAERTRS